jgi:hypothetical protein
MEAQLARQARRKEGPGVGLSSRKIPIMVTGPLRLVHLL